MGYDPTKTCPTPSCIAYADKWHNGKHRVTDTEFHKHPQCDSCGGKLIDGKWEHKCKVCKSEVEPGQLRGLFVPHLCAGCYTLRQKNDRKCGMCRKPIVDCYC